jgi:hypothetical protein
MPEIDDIEHLALVARYRQLADDCIRQDGLHEAERAAWIKERARLVQVLEMKLDYPLLEMALDYPLTDGTCGIIHVMNTPGVDQKLQDAIRNYLMLSDWQEIADALGTTIKCVQYNLNAKLGRSLTINFVGLLAAKLPATWSQITKEYLK